MISHRKEGADVQNTAAGTTQTRKAVIFIGLQGSGKTRFYQTHFAGAYVHINLDELHTRNKEREAIRSCFDGGRDFVVDNTDPSAADRKRYIDAAKERGYRVIGYFFESKIRDCIRRNAQREGKARVPVQAIAATSNKLEIPSYAEGFDELYYVPFGEEATEWRENE